MTFQSGPFDFVTWGLYKEKLVCDFEFCAALLHV